MSGELELETKQDDPGGQLPIGDPAGLREVEAILFASSEPLSLEELTLRLPGGSDVLGLLETLQRQYASRGVNLVKVAGRWCFRTAEDLAYLMHKNVEEQKKLSRAALETLAIIAYHQPVTRAEIEEIRGVSTSKGTLDVLLETAWIRMRGRRRTPGRPVTYGTTDQFLIHFGLENVKDLPGLEELKGAGLLDSAVPASFMVPTPNDDASLTDDEDPLDEGSLFDEEPERP
ncbi:SMC-Scp complex subunit ScpB [Roseibium denhamense]|uniref:Condensin subunit ScpB n=1 Tax=Roseibium denhamense TaxID=76305 RepID=A0ABY1PEC3_9HYPH|nr:SMC-Scp complex subunit ScpB [Roseibium denhamense]MTI06165.1 SMC-Scp complex subunit ScpB [Roseibium denhamense]SMP32341.1 condensin subunit ScpB [Roseibium denhamense]